MFLNRSEEPINGFNMDITTGHVILSYMEEHLNDKNRLAKEWEELCSYEPDTVKSEVAAQPQNMTKNRYSNILPCKLIPENKLYSIVFNLLNSSFWNKQMTILESSWVRPRRANT